MTIFFLAELGVEKVSRQRGDNLRYLPADQRDGKESRPAHKRRQYKGLSPASREHPETATDDRNVKIENHRACEVTSDGVTTLENRPFLATACII